VQFAYEGMTSDGKVVADRVEAASSGEAAETLRGKGLTVLRLDAGRGGQAGADKAGLKGAPDKGRSHDLVLFTRQMKMLLEAGSAVVPALEAIEQQATRPAFARAVRTIREHVEQGGTLSEAFAERPNVFKPVFCSMVSAGEATGKLPGAFDRLAELMMRQQQVRKSMLGALLYPMILSVLCIGVAGVVIGFVIPRFRGLFENLNTPLPPVTRVMFVLSEQALHYWPVGVGLVAGLIVGVIVMLRVVALRRHFDTFLVRLPMIGRLAARVLFARVLRIWAAMLRCHVPLLEAIGHSKSAVTSAIFIGLVREIEEAVESGKSIGRTLGESGLVEPVVASAIRTGEENGRLAEAVDFVSRWIDEDNARMISGLTRIAEPALLTVMGLFVGLVAMALFIPLFDLATAGV
jgi:type II secretory pathway component PulF